MSTHTAKPPVRQRTVAKHSRHTRSSVVAACGVDAVSEAVVEKDTYIFKNGISLGDAATRCLLVNLRKSFLVRASIVRAFCRDHLL